MINQSNQSHITMKLILIQNLIIITDNNKLNNLKSSKYISYSI